MRERNDENWFFLKKKLENNFLDFKNPYFWKIVIERSEKRWSTSVVLAIDMQAVKFRLE